MKCIKKQAADTWEKFHVSAAFLSQQRHTVCEFVDVLYLFLMCMFPVTVNIETVCLLSRKAR